MKTLKSIVLILISIVAVGAIILNLDRIKEKFKTIETSIKKEVVIKDPNEFTKKYNFKYIKQVNNYEPHNIEDIKNIYYSVLNQGWDEFTFYCSEEYTTCLEDMESVSNNQELLSDINNYVNPFNSYSSIRTTYDDQGEVRILVKHVYSKEEVETLNKAIDKIIKDNTNDNQTIDEKIKSIHDYIINTTKYDTVKSTTKTSTYDSSRIGGIINDHYAICSAYADITAVILDKLGLENYKISSSNHVWNAVKVNNNWLHLDLTWDDPVSSSGIDTLIHTYFLITEQELLKADEEETLDGNTKIKEEHNYNRQTYPEISNQKELY